MIAALAIGLWLEHVQLDDANRQLRNAATLVACRCVYPPDSAVGARIAKTVQESYSGIPGVSIRYDEASGELDISASKELQAAIQAGIEVMDKAASAEMAEEVAAISHQDDTAP